MQENVTHPAESAVAHHSPASEKIRLFRSLFHRRENVYPRRFENKNTGRAGYAPACANEWVRGICEKPRIKCADCPHRAFLAVTDEVIRLHLSGKDNHGKDFVAGVYPMLADETCFFLAMDFDKESWCDDVLAVMATCRRLDIRAALERSRSGNGGHVWLFFSHAIPASIARKLGSFILTETMEQRPEIGLSSYDRLFPNQDTLRRLIRDGVDAPLAGLFVLATQPPSDEQRARSAAEAFLFQRLESLTETTGLFRLNAKLPIPFDNWSEIEIDLYCSQLKLAIEIDGPQHLADPAAYRRDRRKDALLQENSFHVLRFLAEDLSKHLDVTLDAIHRAIAHLRRKL